MRVTPLNQVSHSGYLRSYTVLAHNEFVSQSSRGWQYFILSHFKHCNQAQKRKEKKKSRQFLEDHQRCVLDLSIGEYRCKKTRLYAHFSDGFLLETYPYSTLRDNLRSTVHHSSVCLFSFAISLSV